MPTGSSWGLGIASVVAAALILHRGVERFSSPLRRAANVLHALHAGDYSVRASTNDTDEALGLILHEVNELARTLHEHRLAVPRCVKVRIGGGGRPWAMSTSDERRGC